MALTYKKYKNYNQYLSHQSKKLNTLLPTQWGRNFDGRYKNFMKRLNESISFMEGENVLCLGARTGEEVKAFRDLGFKNTKGIDLNPGPNNNYVEKGDFHNLTNKDNEIDTIYTNCLDHSFDLEKIINEINRVMKKDGTLILEFGTSFDNINIEKHLYKSNKYESMLWNSLDDITKEFKLFTVVKKFKNPHCDYHTIILKKNS